MPREKPPHRQPPHHGEPQRPTNSEIKELIMKHAKSHADFLRKKLFDEEITQNKFEDEVRREIHTEILIKKNFEKPIIDVAVENRMCDFYLERSFRNPHLAVEKHIFLRIINSVKNAIVEAERSGKEIPRYWKELIEREAAKRTDKVIKIDQGAIAVMRPMLDFEFVRITGEKSYEYERLYSAALEAAFEQH